jgi:hypothetical protein
VGPHAAIHYEARLISQLQDSLGLDLSRPDCDLHALPRILKDPYIVNDADSLNTAKLIQGDKAVAFLLDAAVVGYLLDVSILVKHYAKVILDSGESLVGQLHITIGEKVNASFLHYGFIFIASILEESRLYHGSKRVHQLNIQEVAL